jgi:hypothetical protein
MSSFKDFYLSENVNKFNISWQLVRTEARDIKDVSEKISFVLKFLKDHPNKHNYGRVHNWLRMTKLGYKSQPKEALKFDNALETLDNKKENYSSEEDYEVDLKDLSNEKIKKVYKDLKKRKYGFQIKTIPKAHTAFLSKLEKEIAEREK